MIHLGFDARFINSQNTGIGWYADNLLRRLSQQDSITITAFATEQSLPYLPEGIRIKRAPPFEQHPRADVWEHLTLPAILTRHRIAVFHSPGFYLPAVTVHCKRIVTIHDLAVFRYPQHFPRKFSCYFQAVITLAATRADRIITGSHCAAAEIRQQFPRYTGPIDVIYHGVDPLFTPVQTSDEKRFLTSTYNLPDGGYFLFVGTLEPRKNLSGLLKAFLHLLRTVREPVSLVIIGRQGWLASGLESITEQGEDSRSVRILGYVPREHLPMFYRQAVGLVYPSFYEGFGLPVVEALASGCPVITSNRSALQEISGKAAILINPDDGPALTAAMQCLLTNRQLASRLRTDGLLRATAFSWDQAIATLRELYFLEA